MAIIISIDPSFIGASTCMHEIHITEKGSVPLYETL
jgi:hypothetical protein